jgi:hypothetical protein
MRSFLASLLLVTAFAAFGCAPMGMSGSVELTSAPPPPTVVFDSDPHFNYLPDRHVSVITDDSFGYDMFASGGYYYVYSGSYWYRSQSPRGPFVAIDMRRVPRRIFDVDDHQYRWRSHPQGWRGQQGSDRDHRRDGNPDRPGH